jgi:hypothetical protein
MQQVAVNESPVAEPSKAKPILFSGAMVRAIISGQKTQTRRLVTPQTSLVNGWPPCMKREPDIIDAWPNLDFTGAWVDRGPSPAGNSGPYLKVPGGDDSAHRIYPRFQPGDLLWVRETFALLWPTEDAPEDIRGHRVEYRADDPLAKYPGGWPDHLGDDDHCPRWKPSIHMPRGASRLTLRVTSVRVERLQDMSKADAISEGAHAMLSSGAPYPESAPRWSMDHPHPVAARPEDGHRACLGSPQMAFANLWNRINGVEAWDANPWVWVISFERVNP